MPKNLYLPKKARSVHWVALLSLQFNRLRCIGNAVSAPLQSRTTLKFVQELKVDKILCSFHPCEARCVLAFADFTLNTPTSPIKLSLDTISIAEADWTCDRRAFLLIHKISLLPKWRKILEWYLNIPHIQLVLSCKSMEHLSVVLLFDKTC